MAGVVVAHVPARRGLVSNRLDLAQLALVDEAFRRRRIARVAQMLRDHQGHPRLIGRVDHVPAFLHGVRHGFLDQHVFAGPCRGDSLRRMQVVAGADIDGIDVGPAQHVVQVQVDVIDAGSFGVVPYCRFDDIARGRETHAIRILQVRGQVPIGNSSGAHQTHLEWFGHDPSVSPCALVGGNVFSAGDSLAQQQEVLLREKASLSVRGKGGIYWGRPTSEGKLRCQRLSDTDSSVPR